LDAHVSSARIADPLRSRGHDVRAATDGRSIDGLDDDSLLELATSEGRILITFDVKDFPRIVGEWAQAGRRHAGCAVVVGIATNEFSLTVNRLNAALASRPAQEDWNDLLVFVSRG